LATPELTLRPMRAADRERVNEISRDIWDGHDYLPRVFDDWLGDAGAAFQAAELEGVVVGVQRLRPFAPGLVWYEALRVVSTHRRQGIARGMLASAIADAKEQGFREMRLGTGNADAVPLFESMGFRRLVDVRWWRGPRVEGGEPARMPDPAGIGMLRIGPGGRALAALREPWGNNLAVAFVAGRGGALRELLMALRFEADADGLNHVTVTLPRDHPAADDMTASGYDLANDDDTAYIYGLTL
jgi:GNAT superfamily N-acetyltransferase